MKEKRTPTQPKPVKENADSPKDMIEYFFPVKSEKGTGYVLPLEKISGVLKNQGVATSHLCQAMAIIIGIMSSRLGDPVPMIVTEDEGAGALELMQVCLTLVPESSWIELPTGKVAKSAEADFGGKTIICYEADTAKDYLSRLLRETEIQKKFDQTKRQALLKKPTSFVALTKNPRHPLLQNRYLTRIHLNADQDSKNGRLVSLLNNSDLDTQRQHKIESACLRKLLSRIKANPVEIDFADQIIKKDALKFQNAVPFMDSMLRILRNITRINNSPPLRPEELPAAFLDLDSEELTINDAANENEPFKATKMDYRYYLMLFDDMFKINNDFLSPRQLAIYGAIFSHNIEHQQKFKSHRKWTLEKMLNQYLESGFSKGWATREDIEARLEGYGEKFSYTTLHNELKILLGYDLIMERKVPHKKNKFGYAATRLLEDETLIETDFSKIDNPQFKESTVEIYNFLKDKTEKI